MAPLRGAFVAALVGLASCDAPDYGTIAGCASGGITTVFCSGTEGYGCTLAGIVQQCGSESNACCADTDGSCEDGTDAVKCIAPAPCSAENTKAVFCDDAANLACTEAVITQTCGKVRNACCAVPDGSCAVGTSALKCINASDYGLLAQCRASNTNAILCNGTDRYGCTLASINASCGNTSNACCADRDGSCVDGDDAVRCISARSPDYGVLGRCSVENTNPIFCNGTGHYGCTLASISARCGNRNNACCADMDGSCADGDDAVKCSGDAVGLLSGGFRWHLDSTLGLLAALLIPATWFL